MRSAGRAFGVVGIYSRQKQEWTAEQFRLADRAKADVYALSGGMAQRLMVARSIAHRPHILFLAAPTAGLDPESARAVLALMEGGAAPDWVGYCCASSAG